MAVKRETPSASVAAWRRFNKLARQVREADDDAELRALLLVRTKRAFEEWVAATEAGK